MDECATPARVQANRGEHQAQAALPVRIGCRKGRFVEVNEEFLTNVVRMLDSLIAMARDKLVWQNLAIPFLGEDWKEKFERARADPYFLGEWELQVAEFGKMRNAMVATLDQLRRGDPVHPPPERIN